MMNLDSLKDRFHRRILPGMGWLAILAVHRTLRIRIIDEDRVQTLRAQNQRVIYAFWHGRFYMILRYFAGQKVCAMASISRDGMLIADILQRMGYVIAAGSSSKSALRALATSMRMIQAGSDLVITVDGPKGPAGVVKPGALYLARKTGAWIVPFTFTASSFITLRSWDRYRIPLPFSRVLLVFGKPISSLGGLDEADLNAECEKLAAKLNALETKADKMMKRWNPRNPTQQWY